uniref:Uncharacterized protein n=1 Tax=Timema cristinae TaxID=61476 RepID=A0A7R9H2A5_TIMCR|nr:unnamed protein product [Timema cristinae]
MTLKTGRIRDISVTRLAKSFGFDYRETSPHSTCMRQNTLIDASDVVFDCCAHAHIGGGGEEGRTARKGTCIDRSTDRQSGQTRDHELGNIIPEEFPGNLLNHRARLYVEGNRMTSAEDALANLPQK